MVHFITRNYNHTLGVSPDADTPTHDVTSLPLSSFLLEIVVYQVVTGLCLPLLAPGGYCAMYLPPEGKGPRLYELSRGPGRGPGRVQQQGRRVYRQREGNHSPQRSWELPRQHKHLLLCTFFGPVVSSCGSDSAPPHPRPMTWPLWTAAHLKAASFCSSCT